MIKLVSPRTIEAHKAHLKVLRQILPTDTRQDIRNRFRDQKWHLFRINEMRKEYHK